MRTQSSLKTTQRNVISMNQVRKNAFVVVGTGEGARFFRNVGTVNDIKLESAGRFNAGDMADEGPAGKSPPEQSDKESMEATFSKQLANRLYAMAHAGKYDELVLVLDPETLGEVRPLLHKEVQDKLVFDLAKTLSNSSTDEIARSLQAAA